MEAAQTPPPTPPEQPHDYPMTYSVDYPDRELNRLSTFFRIFAAIPILIVLGAVNASSSGQVHQVLIYATGGGMLTLGPLLMILFRRKYPVWWVNWNREFLRFSARVGVYLSLLNDQYPSTDEEQTVHLDFPTPNAKEDLSQGLPLVKWLLAIPHYIVLFFLLIGAFFAVIIAWFAILFTGRYPRGLFDYVVGVHRWGLRVVAYAFILVTDEYPPFSLRP
jgi:Domain of unknown function (DUF4389)